MSYSSQYTVVGIYEDETEQTFVDTIFAEGPRHALEIAEGNSPNVRFLSIFRGDHQDLMAELESEGKAAAEEVSA